jgi:hypothetical protein
LIRPPHFDNLTAGLISVHEYVLGTEELKLHASPRLQCTYIVEIEIPVQMLHTPVTASLGATPFFRFILERARCNSVVNNNNPASSMSIRVQL